MKCRAHLKYCFESHLNKTIVASKHLQQIFQRECSPDQLFSSSHIVQGLPLKQLKKNTNSHVIKPTLQASIIFKTCRLEKYFAI